MAKKVSQRLFRELAIHSMITRRDHASGRLTHYQPGEVQTTDGCVPRLGMCERVRWMDRETEPGRARGM